MITKGKVKVKIIPVTRQWAKTLRQKRMYTTMGKMKELMDFADRFYPVKTETRRETLNLLLVNKSSPTPGTLALEISPLINISIKPYLKTLLVYSPLVKSSILSKLSTHIYRDNRNIGNQYINRVFPFTGTDTARVLKSISNVVYAPNRLPENVYKYKTITIAALPGEDKISPSAPGVTTILNNIYTGNHGATNTYHMISPACMTQRNKTKTLNPSPDSKTIIIPGTTKRPITLNTLQTHTRLKRYIKHFYQLRRLDRFSRDSSIYIHVFKKSKSGESRQRVDYIFPTAKSADNQRIPPYSQVVPAALEMVTKKVKKIEQINKEEVEKTIYQKVSKQVEQTIHQGIQKRLVFNSSETQQLTENIYSRLVNRITLEKERLGY